MKSLRSKMILGSLIMGLGVAHSGLALAAFDSFGKEIPLESAARQIVPEGTKVDFGTGVDKTTAVTWGSSSDWQSALSSAVARKGLKARFSDGGVVIEKAAAPEASTRPYSSTPSSDIVQRRHATHPVHVARHEPRRPVRHDEEAPRAEEADKGATSGFVIRAYHQGSGPTEPRDHVAPVQGHGMVGKDPAFDDASSHEGSGKYVVAEGYKLHGTLDAWASATGWKVIWNSDHDYLIQANATFSGDFVKASSDLITAMGDARPQITVDYYQGNKVIVISNKLSDEVNK